MRRHRSSAAQDHDVAGGTPGRLPDFLVIGAMKSGTTTLFRWLAEQPDVFMPVKEIHFFSRDAVWKKGLDWYERIFADALASQLAGEASPSYMDPRHGDRTVDRIVRTIPEARFVCVLREPVARLRSHYRHEVQRGRERRSLRFAVHPRSAYVTHSLYFQRLRPYFDVFPRERICVVRFEDLYSDNALAWDRIMAHLGLPERMRPEGAYNRATDKPYLRRTLATLSEKGFLERARVAPAPLRRAGKRFFLRAAQRHEKRVERAIDEPLPVSVVEQIAADAADLAGLLGVDRPLWPTMDSGAADRARVAAPNGSP